MLAVITGASRGIGKGYARQLAGRGFDLYIVARDAARLTAVAQATRAAHQVQVTEIVLDLARPDSAERLYAEVRSRNTPVDLLVNNAGFGLYGEFTDTAMPRIQEMLHLHVLTVTKLMRLFLPEMRERRKGAIINVASVGGLLPVPYMALYAATKGFIVSLGLSVGREVQKDGVYIQTCCPGQTLTDFHATAGHRPHTIGSRQIADRVVEESLAALDRRKSLVITGPRNRLLINLQKLVPQRLLLWAAGHTVKAMIGKKVR
jgi:uncharacterized protein